MKVKNKKATTIVLLIVILIISTTLVLGSKNLSFIAYGETDMILEDETVQTVSANQCLEIFSENGNIEMSDVICEDITNDINPQTRSSIPQFNERKLLYSGRPDEYSIVISIMGDGFTSSEQDLFIDKAQEMVDYMFGNETTGIPGIAPFNEYKSLFTIYAIEVISEESGVNKDVDKEDYYRVNLDDYKVNNYFGSSFYYGNYHTEYLVERALVIENKSKVDELKKPYSALEVVVCNSNRRGGTGGQTVITSIHPEGGRIIAHEVGHSLANLADEYYYPDDGPFKGYEAINRTATNNIEQIKWANYVGQEGIGAIPLSHGVDRQNTNFDNESDNWFKPSEHCLMHNSTEAFCLVCKNGMIEAFSNILGDSFEAEELGIEIFSDFGYKGSTYYWLGRVLMKYDADNLFNAEEILVIVDNSSLDFELSTISSENEWLVTNGEIRFELEQSDGQIIQTNICTVTVDILNNVTFTGNTFSINTSQLGTGTYFLKMYCTFNRGEWSSETTHSYAFGVNRPITVMEDFGYLSSWYKWKGNVKLSSDHLYLFNNSNSLTLMGDVDLTFTIGTSFAFNAVKEMTGTVTIELPDSSGNIIPINGNNKHTSNIRVGLASNVSISNSSFTINISDFADDTYTLRLDCRMTRGSTTYNNSDTYSFSVRNETCIAQGTMITLADGTQKAVEDLTGDEQLLVWNMLTGQFDTAPILFIDSDEQRFYQVVNLYFSDGTSVKVIGEHAFWNKDLNEYVFLRKDADQYIGDSFIKQTTNDNGEMVSSEVLLIDVVVTMEHTTAWSPVTYGHLCYYVNGMLSMPGATEGLINIFEVDPDAMRYDEEAMNRDIATYGLFTYEEFNALIPVPEEIFEAFNGQYLKVSIGKGYTSIEELAQLIERYSQFF